jgi:hypothetical protein
VPSTTPSRSASTTTQISASVKIASVATSKKSASKPSVLVTYGAGMAPRSREKAVTSNVPPAVTSVSVTRVSKVRERPRSGSKNPCEPGTTWAPV